MFDCNDKRPLSEAQLRFHADEARIRGKRGQLLELLLDGNWHPNHDCAAITLGLHSAIYGLRAEGWTIESRHISMGRWDYRLSGKTEPPPVTQKMSMQQRRIARLYTEALTDNLDTDAMSSVLDAIPGWMRIDLSARADRNHSNEASGT